MSDVIIEWEREEEKGKYTKRCLFYIEEVPRGCYTEKKNKVQGENTKDTGVKVQYRDD